MTLEYLLIINECSRMFCFLVVCAFTIFSLMISQIKGIIGTGDEKGIRHFILVFRDSLGIISSFMQDILRLVFSTFFLCFINSFLHFLSF